MTVYRVLHRTAYHYAGDVVSSHNEAHLTPRTLPTQRPRRVEMHVEPAPDGVLRRRDYFGNDVVAFSLQTPHHELEIRSECEVELRAAPAFDAARSTPWEQVARTVREDRSPDALEAFEYVFDSPFVAASETLAAYARPSFAPGRPVAEALLDFMHRIHAEFDYDPKATTLDTSVEDALRERHGVCQDFAHVMIGGLRSLGLPARYVSGYLRSSRPAEPARSEAKPSEVELIGAEASHAWVASWCPVLGWLAFDPTNDLVPGDRHVVLAWGRDYDDVSPVKGVTLGGGSHTVEVSVRVRPLDEPA